MDQNFVIPLGPFIAYKTGKKSFVGIQLFLVGLRKDSPCWTKSLSSYLNGFMYLVFCRFGHHGSIMFKTFVIISCEKLFLSKGTHHWWMCCEKRLDCPCRNVDKFFLILISWKHYEHNYTHHISTTQYLPLSLLNLRM